MREVKLEPRKPPPCCVRRDTSSVAGGAHAPRFRARGSRHGGCFGAGIDCKQLEEKTMKAIQIIRKLVVPALVAVGVVTLSFVQQGPIN